MHDSSCCTTAKTTAPSISFFCNQTNLFLTFAPDILNLLNADDITRTLQHFFYFAILIVYCNFVVPIVLQKPQSWAYVGGQKILTETKALLNALFLTV